MIDGVTRVGPSQLMPLYLPAKFDDGSRSWAPAALAGSA